MSGSSVVIVRTGTANLASVAAGLRRAGAICAITEDAALVADAERVVLPGVGTMQAAMSRLAENGLVDVLARRVREGRPTLAICLGMQLLFEGSDESPGTRGLSVLAGRATRFPATVRVPQIGWNHVEPEPAATGIEPGYAYFANSYRIESAPSGWAGAFAVHGDRWLAACERGAVLACQFHPELSGAWGTALLRRWLAGATVPC